MKMNKPKKSKTQKIEKKETKSQGGNIVLALVVLIFISVIGVVLVQQNQPQPVIPEMPDIPEAPEIEQPQTFSSGEVTERTIEIKNFLFEPKELKITKGTKVTWVNRDYLHEDQIKAWPHSIKIYGPNIRSPRLNSDEEFSYAFNEPGTYKYIDSIYPKTMQGTIIVADETISLTGGVVLEPAGSSPMIGLIAIIVMLSIAIGFFSGFKYKKAEAAYKSVPIKILSLFFIILIFIIPSF